MNSAVINDSQIQKTFFNWNVMEKLKNNRDQGLGVGFRKKSALTLSQSLWIYNTAG